MVTNPCFRVQERVWTVFPFYIHYPLAKKITSGHFSHSDHFLFRLWFAIIQILMIYSCSSNHSSHFPTIINILPVLYTGKLEVSHLSPYYIFSIYLFHNFSQNCPSFLFLSDPLSMNQLFTFTMVKWISFMHSCFYTHLPILKL